MDTSIAAALTYGFFLGLQHALEADHVVAVSTIVSEHKSIARSSIIGTFWGLGHTASLFAAGLALLLLKVSIPEGAAPWMEMPVAIMLIGLGIHGIWRVLSNRGLQIHSHLHEHEDQPRHKHIHIHAGGGHEHKHHLLRVGRRPFLVGMVHGLAGSGVAVAAAIAAVPTLAFGLTWIAVFGLGSVGGMLLMSAMISLPFVVTARRFSALNSWIRLLAGALSIIFGLLLAWNLLGEIRGFNS
ncbi:MAG TPA: urease accessory protein UreH [Blastocatellia bacterium]|jgi:high-affinity nickel permease